MANLAKLPKVSKTFRAHLADHPLQKNEWMPCPRCGAENVEPPQGKLIGAVSGGALIGCWVVIIGALALIFAFLFFPIALVIGVVGLVLIPFLPAIGAGMGMLYKCKSCNYNWTFSDATKYQQGMSARN